MTTRGECLHIEEGTRGKCATPDKPSRSPRCVPPGTSILLCVQVHAVAVRLALRGILHISFTSAPKLQNLLLFTSHVVRGVGARSHLLEIVTKLTAPPSPSSCSLRGWQRCRCFKHFGRINHREAHCLQALCCQATILDSGTYAEHKQRDLHHHGMIYIWGTRGPAPLGGLT